MAPRFPTIRPELARRYRNAGHWRGVLCDAALDAAAARRGQATALVDRRGAMSWRSLDDAASRFAAGLAARGVAAGDVVSWSLPNWREAAIVHWAVLRLGAVSNPIVPIYRHREVRFILEQARSRAIVVPSRFRGFDYEAMMRELSPELEALGSVIVVEGDAPRASADGEGVDFDALLAHDPQPPATGRRSDDPALLLYTSGTTADPKGAVHTHDTLDVELRTMVEFYELGDDTIVYMPSPLSHVTGLLYGIQLPALLAGSVVYQERFDADEGLELLAAHGCTFSVGATPFLHGLCEAWERRPRELVLRTFNCGGADVPPALIRRAGELLGCLATRAYGLTEFPTITGGNARDPEAKRAETDGRVMDHCEVRVVDEAGREVGPGVPGELQARGPELFTGYLGGVAPDALDDEGWFSTGDLVSLRDGYLTVEGRIKDIILRGGENIAVKEVEDLLFGHPEVEEVAIVAMPDLVLTERACAFVVAAPGSDPTLESLVAFLETHRLARQKLPERLERVDALPKTASGKVQKHRLRERIRAILESGSEAVAGPGA